MAGLSEQQLIDLKERIALLAVEVPGFVTHHVAGVTPQMFTPVERDYLLDAINQKFINAGAVDGSTVWEWACGHSAGAVCKECHEALIGRANSLAAALHHELDENNALRQQIKQLRKEIEVVSK